MVRQQPPLRQEFMQQILLLVEGLDDVKFFGTMLDHLSITGVQILNLQGVSRLRNALASVKQTPGFRKIRKIGIIRDADISEKSAHQSVKFALLNAGFYQHNTLDASAKSVPEISVFILSRKDGVGMLESLICETLSGKEVWRCVEEFIECSRHLSDLQTMKVDKSRVNAYLSTTESPNVSIGDAASKRYWNYDHPSLESLRSFLYGLRQI